MNEAHGWYGGNEYLFQNHRLAVNPSTSVVAQMSEYVPAVEGKTRAPHREWEVVFSLAHVEESKPRNSVGGLQYRITAGKLKARVIGATREAARVAAARWIDAQVGRGEHPLVVVAT